VVNKPNWIPTATSRICQRHFKIDDFSNTAHKRMRLKNDVVPSQNLPNQNPNKDTSKYMNINCIHICTYICICIHILLCINNYINNN